MSETPDYMTLEERSYYNDRLQQWLLQLPDRDLLMGEAIRQGVSYAKVRSSIINSFKQQAFRETARHFNALERWQAAKGSARKSPGRPAKYTTEAARKEAHQQSKARYKRSERGRLVRKVRKVEIAQNAKEERIQRLLQKWDERKLLIDWKELDIQQKQLLRKCLPEGNQPKESTVDAGVRRLVNRLDLTEGKQECQLQL